MKLWETFLSYPDKKVGKAEVPVVSGVGLRRGNQLAGKVDSQDLPIDEFGLEKIGEANYSFPAGTGRSMVIYPETPIATCLISCRSSGIDIGARDPVEDPVVAIRFEIVWEQDYAFEPKVMLLAYSEPRIFEDESGAVVLVDRYKFSPAEHQLAITGLDN